MQTATSITRGVAAAILLAGLALPAAAENFRVQIDLEHVGKHAISVEHVGVDKIIHGTMTGGVTSASNGSLAGATDLKAWTVVIPIEGRPNLVGTDSLRTGNGSVLHVRYEGVPSFATKDGIGYGTWAVLGGTGEFADVSGGGEFTYRSTDTGGVKVFEGELGY